MSGTTIVRVGEGTGLRLRLRHLWLVPGLAIAIVANELGKANGIGILTLIAFGIAPDLPRLIGSRGRLAHNLLHRPALRPDPGRDGRLLRGRPEPRHPGDERLG